MLAQALVLCMACRTPADRAVPPLVVANDNRTPAGTLRDGALTLELDVIMARWYPEAADGPFVDVAAFAERGKAPMIPGPLVRVPVGTRVRLVIRNTLADTTIGLWGMGVAAAVDTTTIGSWGMGSAAAADTTTIAVRPHPRDEHLVTRSAGRDRPQCVRGQRPFVAPYRTLRSHRG
jgi:hypothetical protein